MGKKGNAIIVVLLLVAAFLAGSAVARRKYGEGPHFSESNSASQGKQEGEGAQTVNPTPPPFNSPKSKKPEVKFFVMSFCPYGNQAEAGLEPVYQLLKNKVTWSPRYILNDKKSSCEQGCPYRIFDDNAQKRCEEAVKQGQVKDMETCKGYFPYTSADECLKKECASLKAGEYDSLHGIQELNQDIREICAFNLGNLDKWWKFVGLVNEKCTSQNADTCWKEHATAAGLDANRISQCEKNQFKALAVKEVAESAKYQASGSPMVFINQTVYNGGRSPESYKKTVCSAFENPPEECETVLSSEGATASGGCN